MDSATLDLVRSRILDRDTTLAAPGSVCRPVQCEGEEVAVRVRGVVAERRAGDESVAHV